MPDVKVPGRPAVPEGSLARLPAAEMPNNFGILALGLLLVSKPDKKGYIFH